MMDIPRAIGGLSEDWEIIEKIATGIKRLGEWNYDLNRILTIRKYLLRNELTST